jgi:hypothetical protein
MSRPESTAMIFAPSCLAAVALTGSYIMWNPLASHHERMEAHFQLVKSFFKHRKLNEMNVEGLFLTKSAGQKLTMRGMQT